MVRSTRRVPLYVRDSDVRRVFAKLHRGPTRAARTADHVADWHCEAERLNAELL